MKFIRVEDTFYVYKPAQKWVVIRDLFLCKA